MTVGTIAVIMIRVATVYRDWKTVVPIRSVGVAHVGRRLGISVRAVEVEKSVERSSCVIQ